MRLPCCRQRPAPGGAASARPAQMEPAVLPRTAGGWRWQGGAAGAVRLARPPAGRLRCVLLLSWAGRPFRGRFEVRPSVTGAHLGSAVRPSHAGDLLQRRLHARLLRADLLLGGSQQAEHGLDHFLSPWRRLGCRRCRRWCCCCCRSRWPGPGRRCRRRCRLYCGRVKSRRRWCRRSCLLCYRLRACRCYKLRAEE